MICVLCGRELGGVLDLDDTGPVVPLADGTTPGLGPELARRLLAEHGFYVDTVPGGLGPCCLSLPDAAFAERARRRYP